MLNEGISGHFADTLQHLFGHWESQRKEAAIPGGHTDGFTITVSREAGTQGTAVAKELGTLLGWHVYDHELLEQIARNMGLRGPLARKRR